MAEDEPADRLFIVQQGWLHSSIRIATGGRQILRFHYPGDLVGVSSIAWSRTAHTLTAVSDCTVSEMSKTNLGRIFFAEPRLGGVLYALAAADHVAMGDRLTSVARMGSAERLSALFLDIAARLRLTEGGVVDTFDLPLTQQDIGDAVGLTKVHVSRTLSDMERRGLIARTARRITLLDEAGMKATTGFVDRYAEIDTGWLPPSSQAEAA